LSELYNYKTTTFRKLEKASVFRKKGEDDRILDPLVDLGSDLNLDHV
jgi:hypothetical protein